MTALTIQNTNIPVLHVFVLFFLLVAILAGQHAVAGDDTFAIVQQKLMEDPADTNSLVAASGVDTGSTYLAVDKGVARGGSLDATNSSQIHEFDIYGRSASNSGEAIIIIGYKKRY